MKKLVYSIAIVCLLLVSLVSCTTEEIEISNTIQENTNTSSFTTVIEPVIMPLKPR